MTRKVTSIPDLFEQQGYDNVDAFKELYAAYKEPVYLMVKRRVPDAEEARDITQDVFAHLWSMREKIAGVQHFDSWLYALVRNKVISAYRHNSIRMRGEQILAGALASADWDSEAIAIAKELDLRIAAVVDRLPDTMRKCYYMSRNEGMDNHEIAKLLNLSEKTVRNNLSEATKRLRTDLAPHYPEFLLFLLALDRL